MTKPKKYLFDNGVMKINPEYTAWKADQDGVNPGPAQSSSQLPLAVITSMEDVADASLEQHSVTGTSLQLAESTAATLEIIQDEEFTQEFDQPGEGMDGSELLEGLTAYFATFEVPLGLINKLMALQMYHLKFIIDDSGSMNAGTDSMISEAHEAALRGQTLSRTTPMTRWQEAETRLHTMVDILSFIPTKSIEIRFMNASNVINLQRSGKTREDFAKDSHAQIVENFSTIEVKYRTPTLRVLTESFRNAAKSREPCMHYLVTDGVPTDCIVQQVADLIKTRSNPERNPLTLISCTDEDDEVEWMKQVEEVAPYCSEIDDYTGEKAEILNDQGVAFPYTKGYWLISQLVSAINPNDLDAMDENVPFTKNTLDNMLGRIHTPQEYQYYFERNPHASLYLDLYSKFLNEPSFARTFVSRQEQARRESEAGYIDGKRTVQPPSPNSLSPRLVAITASAASSNAVGSSGGETLVQAIAYPI